MTLDFDTTAQIYLLSLLDNVVELSATQTRAQLALTCCLIKF